MTVPSTSANTTVQQAAASSTTNQASAPPNASAANKNNPVFTGLCEALNSHQQNLVKQGKYEIADIYEIEFAPATLAKSTVKKPGNTDFANAPLQAQDPNGKSLLPSTNSVNTNSRTEAVLAGTQIVQFIDKVMRNSSYMSDQLLYTTDEVTGETVASSNNKNGSTAWYKISVTATPLPGFDNKRHDHAYRMKYVISPYAINQMQSEYFPKARFRGLHKVYNYWFTGQNTEVLDFQQEYNNLYRLVVSGLNVPIIEQQTSNPINITKKTFMAQSGQSVQGAANNANEPIANAADYLYSPTDQAKVKIRIAGDPAWMQQGEATVGISASTFNFSPFNADGGINYDSQEVVFAIQWNRPQDYNFETGIADVSANNVTGTPAIGMTSGSQPQESFAYTAIKVKNTFSKGRFEQEIEGRLLVDYNSNLQGTNATGNTPAGAPASPTVAGSTAALPNTSTDSANPNTQGDNIARQAQRSTPVDPANIVTPNSPTPVQNDLVVPVNDSQPMTAPIPLPPTSNGTVVGATNTLAPQTAGSLSLQQQIQNVVNAEQAGVNNTPQIENRST